MLLIAWLKMYGSDVDTHCSDQDSHVYQFRNRSVLSVERFHSVSLLMAIPVMIAVVINVLSISVVLVSRPRATALARAG